MVLLVPEEKKLYSNLPFEFLREVGSFDKNQFHLSGKHRYKSSRSFKGNGKKRNSKFSINNSLEV